MKLPQLRGILLFMASPATTPLGKLHKVKIDRDVFLRPLLDLERWITEIEKQFPGAPIVDQLGRQVDVMRAQLSLLHSFGPDAHIYLADAEWLAAKKGITPNHARDLLAGKALHRIGNLQLFSRRSLDSINPDDSPVS